MTLSPSPLADHAQSPEIWLRTNVRALAVGLVMMLGLMSVGASAVWLAGRFEYGIGLRVLGILALVGGGYAAASLVYQMTLPRLARAGDELLVYLQSSRPIRVPLEIVELFFLGHGTSFVPATQEGPSKSRTVVIRLAEAATQWHDLPINTAQGQWREAYIIIRGTWCEPLTTDVLKSLNQRLAQVHRERRAAQESAS